MRRGIHLEVLEGVGDVFSELVVVALIFLGVLLALAWGGWRRRARRAARRALALPAPQTASSAAAADGVSAEAREPAEVAATA